MKLSNLLAVSTAAVASASAFAIGLDTQEPLTAFDSPVPGNSHISWCSDPAKDKIVIENIKLDPYPPAPGKPLHFEASGTVKERIDEGAYLKVTVKLNRYIRLMQNQTLDFCENIKKADAGVECPIEEGPLSIIKDVEIPNTVPPGTYTVMAYLFQADDSLITCLSTQVSIHH
ncbi:hypothetical protein ABW21_db0206359 [Orbilia brochopaga]|nr:hypothetical protein ABW21_db0206359 [Drechslerella brochopaga]